MRRWHGRAAWLLPLLGVMACTTGSVPPAGGGAAAAPEAEDLVASLGVEVRATSVDLTLHVTNATSAPLTLHFPSAQRYDFGIRLPDGETVWSWSAARSFAQVEGEEVVGPGETLTYHARWEPEGRSGVFVARGELVSSGGGVAQETEFRVPS